MKIIKMKIADLIHDPANARKHDDKNLSAIKGSLAAFGQQKPIVIDEKNVVLAGNGTLEASKALGWTEIGCVVTDLKTSTDKKAFALADNRTSELASWDTDILSDALKGLTLDDFDITSVGFDLPGLDTPPEGLTDPDDVPEDVDTRAKPGDIWILGNHRVMCGDSTNIQHVEKLMNGEKADMTFTSPPYNAGSFGYDNGKDKYGKKNGDSLNQDEYLDFMVSFTNIALEYSNYVIINNQFLSGNRKALAKFIGTYSDNLKDVFPWIKNTAPPNVNKGVFTNRFEIFICLEKNCDKKAFPVKWQGKYHNVIEGETASSDNVAKDIHSATMPIYVPIWFMERLDCMQSFYEPFCGTGTTLIASEKLGRKCFGMEKEPKYVDVILARWEKFTGKTATIGR